MRLTLNEVMWCAREAGFAGDDIAIAGAVAKAESKLDTDVIGLLTDDNEDLGLWQISTKWHSAKIVVVGASWRHPLVNAHLAKQVFDERVRMGQVGWSAWSVFASKAYEKYLPLARQQVQRGHLWEPTLTHEAKLVVAGISTLNT